MTITLAPDPYPSGSDALFDLIEREGDGRDIGGCVPLVLLMLLAMAFAAGLAVGMCMNFRGA